MADVAATILACAERSGKQWWAEWDGLQWSPTNVTTGRPYRGADRLVLAAHALANGHTDRRWGTTAQLDALNYRVRKLDRAQGIVIGDECLYNAELGRRKRGTGARHDSPVPAEEHVRDERTRDTLRASSAIAPPAMTRQGTVGLARFLHVMALSCMPRGIECASSPEDEAALRPLIADMACAMALSDLGIPPSRARAQEPTANSLTMRWASIIREAPDVLADCAILAETTISVVSSIMLIEAQRRLGHTASDRGTGPVTEKATQVTSDQRVQQAAPAIARESRLAAELHSAAFSAYPLQRHDADTRDQDGANQEYTLQDEAEASRLASKALSGMRPGAQAGN